MLLSVTYLHLYWMQILYYSSEICCDGIVLVDRAYTLSFHWLSHMHIIQHNSLMYLSGRKDGWF